MKNLIISDNPEIVKGIYNINEKLGISNLFDFAISPFSSKNDFFVEVSSIDLKRLTDIEGLRQYNVIFSCHCKQFFPKELLNEHECFNLHPGYNPVNRGWYPQVFAIIHNLPVGATFHKIDVKLDHGDIVDRVFVKKKESDTSFSLYSRIVEAELGLWEKNISSILKGDYSLTRPENEGNLFMKNDFTKLLELNLDSEGTMRDHLSLLRALTFQGYKNAYFKDKNGRKIYVEIMLENE